MRKRLKVTTEWYVYLNLHIFQNFANNTKHPDIASVGESSKIDGLWRHPLNRQYTHARMIIRLIRHPTRETEISKL